MSEFKDNYGKKKKIIFDNLPEIMEMQSKKISLRKIAKVFGVHYSSVYQYLAACKEKNI